MSFVCNFPVLRAPQSLCSPISKRRPTLQFVPLPKSINFHTPNMKITLKTAEKRCFLLIASADLDRLNPLCFTSPAALKKADPIVDMLKHFQAKFWWFWSLKWNLNWFKINFGFHFKLQNHQNFAYKCFKMSTMGSAFFSAAGHNGLRKFKSPLWKYSFWTQKWCISFVIYSKTIPGTKRIIMYFLHVFF